jgi:uncharacterized protein
MQNNLAMQEFVLNLLRNNIPENYYYHNPEHTSYVIKTALEIGRHEGCTEKELELLSIAALWHDTGYVKVYRHHEEESCKMARENLPTYGYSIPEIDIICDIIMATKIPQTPGSKLEQILADADLEYLGTPSFEIKSDNLFREIQTRNPLLTKEKWDQMQILFLQKHHYFTRFCQENRESVKQNYLQELIKATE